MIELVDGLSEQVRRAKERLGEPRPEPRPEPFREPLPSEKRVDPFEIKSVGGGA